MNIAIYGRNFGNNFTGMAIQLFEELKSNNVNIFINKKFYIFLKEKIYYNLLNATLFENELPKNTKIDFLFSVGGDGTFLEASSLIYNSSIPILGINTGRLGFLSYVNSKILIMSIQQVLQGKFTTEKRMLLDVNAGNNFYGNNSYCLNDFVVQKKSSSSMIKTKVFINNSLLNTYLSDGIIISTPTGSTAYSLSCGGPIIEPKSEVILITPIANHNLTVRPIVVSANSEIQVVFESSINHLLVSMDYRSFEIDKIKSINIKKSDKYIYFVNLFENNYFLTLSEKLYWGLDIRT